MKPQAAPHCIPVMTLDLSQGQRVLEHIGAHLLHDPGLTQYGDCASGRDRPFVNSS